LGLFFFSLGFYLFDEEVIVELILCLHPTRRRESVVE